MANFKLSPINKPQLRLNKIQSQYGNVSYKKRYAQAMKIMQKLNGIIESYKLLRGNNPDGWLVDCKNELNLEKCITMAASARNSIGKKHPHQYRIPNKVLESFAEKLVFNVSSIIRSTNFEELYANICENKLKGIGLLTLYDTSHRIGMKLNLHPNKIYLHRGAKIGAERVLNRRIKTRTIDKSELEIFAEFTCAEIEDILCLSKGDLSKVSCFYEKSGLGACT